ncbi:hypothetical protein E2C01_000922 [Portunus trituberculatus]|uniref:Uncharacterized protein n=1 Tax=Portunus trituberculatus TaxID=210409 RepID=A0A5B7CGE1_PORTR|nr:hypothetical protein [Portunus trituberculatus]
MPGGDVGSRKKEEMSLKTHDQSRKGASMNTKELTRTKQSRTSNPENEQCHDKSSCQRSVTTTIILCGHS